MKIIFLDIDGVLNTRRSLRAREKANQKCIAALNSLLLRSDAKIVVSSSWRIGRSRIQMCDTLNKMGVIPGRILGLTPVIDDNYFRGNEIQAWIDMNASRYEIDSFVIIDDDNDMEHLLPHLVQTNMIDGLTEELAAQALSFLRK